MPPGGTRRDARRLFASSRWWSCRRAPNRRRHRRRLWGGKRRQWPRRHRRHRNRLNAHRTPHPSSLPTLIAHRRHRRWLAIQMFEESIRLLGLVQQTTDFNSWIVKSWGMMNNHILWEESSSVFTKEKCQIFEELLNWPMAFVFLCTWKTRVLNLYWNRQLNREITLLIVFYTFASVWLLLRINLIKEKDITEKICE